MDDGDDGYRWYVQRLISCRHTLSRIALHHQGRRVSGPTGPRPCSRDRRLVAANAAPQVVEKQELDHTAVVRLVGGAAIGAVCLALVCACVWGVWVGVGVGVGVGVCVRVRARERERERGRDGASASAVVLIVRATDAMALAGTLAQRPCNGALLRERSWPSTTFPPCRASGCPRPAIWLSPQRSFCF